MNRCMITLREQERLFTLRVAAVIVHGDYILLHRAEGDDFWAMPGGRCEMGEPTAWALRREMQEEMGHAVRVERLLWVIEQFFTWEGADHHEMGFYYLVDPGPAFPRDPNTTFYGHEQERRLIFRWFPAEALEEMTLYPRFLRRALCHLPAAVEHVILEVDEAEVETRRSYAEQADGPDADRL